MDQKISHSPAGRRPVFQVAACAAGRILLMNAASVCARCAGDGLDYVRTLQLPSRWRGHSARVGVQSPGDKNRLDSDRRSQNASLRIF